MVIDFLDLKPLIDEEVGRFNYGFINQDVEEFQQGKFSPSAENIAMVLYQRIGNRLPRVSANEFHEIDVISEQQLTLLLAAARRTSR